MTRRIRRLPSYVLIIVALLAICGIAPAAAAHRDGTFIGPMDDVCASLHVAHARVRNHNAIPGAVANECCNEESRRKAKLRIRASALPVADMPNAPASKDATGRRFGFPETPFSIASGFVPHDYDPQGPPSDTI